MNMTKKRLGLLARVSLLALVGCRPSALSPGEPSAPQQVSPVVLRSVEGALDFVSEVPGTRPLNALQTIGQGCAFLDANADGNLDVLMIARRPQLFLGNGAGAFSRAESFLSVPEQHFIGCAVGDYDGDGYEDLYLSAYRGGALLHNEAGKSFKDVTQGSGITPQPFGTACAWVESVKGSGKLDLLVANYAKFGADQGQPLLCEAKNTAGKVIQTSCPPRQYPPLPAVLFQNQGGRFKALPTPTTGRGLGVAAADAEGEGTLLLSLANDEIAGDLLPLGAGARGLTNIAVTAGTAYDQDGNVHGGMGTDWGDYDNDGKLDLIVSTFSNELKSLYHHESTQIFSDRAQVMGLGKVMQPYVSFGVKFFDADNDGFLDLLFANGHVQDNITLIDPTQSYRQPSVFLRNDGGKHFTDLTKATSVALTKPLVGRGLAVGDYDNDGRVDVLIGDIEGPPLLLRNESPPKSWMGFILEGTKSNRSGYGARITVMAEGKTWVRHCHTDGSYLSASDKRVLVGLGDIKAVERVEILWPSGTRQTVIGAALRCYNRIKEAL